MENLPFYISLVFGGATFLAVIIFLKATKQVKITLAVITGWLILQTIIGLSGFYTVSGTMPPRFLLLILPPLLFIIGLFSTARGKNYIDELDLKTLTLLHTTRILMEMVLFWLFLHKAMPQLMTFEGRNFDIFSGLTAPLVFYFGYIRKQLNKKIILFWNFVCLGILLFTVTNGILSVPTPFQQFAFDQPNIAVLYFPFVWLPALVVPLVCFSHVAAIRQLLLENSRYRQASPAIKAGI